jgi:hypothetical protein
MEIPGYTLQRILGKGGMASVYLAIHDKFEREVALKIMAPVLSADPSFRERFLREAKIVAKISHPNIVAVYDVNEVNNLYYIAMEYHPGGDLKARIREGLSIREALGIVRDIARALDYAHSKGYLHRDIKPDNILFRADGSAVLTDFGIAKATEGDNSHLTQVGIVAGTPKYMSPEQARGQALGADSDLYSLGVVFFEMLTGRLPFEASDPIALGIMHLNSPVPKLEGRLAHFQPLIDRMMAKAGAQRPQRGAEVVQAVDALAASFDFGDVTEAAADGEATAFRPRLQTGKPAPAPVNAPVTPASARMAPAPAPVRKKPLLPLVLAGVAVVGILGTGGYMMMGAKPKVVQAEAVPGVVALQPLLDAGAAALARGDLMTPAGQSAADDFRAVLAQDPANVQAQTGLQQVVAALQKQGMAALQQHDMDGAHKSLDQLHQLAPGDMAVVELEKAVSAAEPAPPSPPPAEAAAPVVRHAVEHTVAATSPKPARKIAHANTDDSLTRLRVQGMLAGADAALSEGDSATAMTRYQQVLQLEPGNAEAREGLRKAKAASH